MPPKNLGTIFLDTAKHFPRKDAVLFKIKGRYEAYSWEIFFQKVEALFRALRQKSLAAGDRVAILSENRPEWAQMDLACQGMGVATVPIYTSLASEEIKYLLADSDAAAIAVSDRALLEKLIPIQRALPRLRFIAAFDASLKISEKELSIPVFTLSEMEAEGSKLAGSYEASAEAIAPETLASIIYTSGTTGVPKGVMLTHANFLDNVTSSRTALQMGETDVHLSFLPLSHVFERMAGYYLMIYIGATIGYAEAMDTVPQNLLEVKPTFVLGVPRFFEKTRDRVLEAVKAAGSFKRALFFWAKELGERKRLGRPISPLSAWLADRLVYRKFRSRLGGRVRFCVSGGAPLPKEAAEFFHDLGVMIYEGYGLTETSPVISVNREGRFKFGTVGIPLETIEVRIAEDGEITTRSPSVMKGYYKKPEETAEALKDGWFHTGDLGLIDKDGFLTITGRKKEILVTSGGKKVATRYVEELVESDSFVLRCVLYGDGKKFITALVVPRQEELLEYARSQKIAFGNYAELLKNPLIYRLFEQKIEEGTKELANYEKIKYFVLLERDFTQAAGELTPTLKVKRDVVLSRYKTDLDRLYVQ